MKLIPHQAIPLWMRYQPNAQTTKPNAALSGHSGELPSRGLSSPGESSNFLHLAGQPQMERSLGKSTSYRWLQALYRNVVRAVQIPNY
jgi:hypothetical protein